MPLQPKISPENLKLRIADRQKEIPPPDNPDGSYNLDGFKYKPGDFDKFTSWWTFAQDTEKECKEKFFYPFIDEGSSFLDIGALCGSWTLPALKIGASVMSIEPDPNFYNILKNNVKLNGFHGWTGINAGMYDHIFIGDVYDMEKVKFLTLDSILVNDLYIKSFTYVKIDVEGAELEVLRGGYDFLRVNRPVLWIECHEEDFGISPEMVTKELGNIFKSSYMIRKKTPVLATPHILAVPSEYSPSYETSIPEC